MHDKISYIIILLFTITNCKNDIKRKNEALTTENYQLRKLLDENNEYIKTLKTSSQAENTLISEYTILIDETVKELNNITKEGDRFKINIENGTFSESNYRDSIGNSLNRLTSKIDELNFKILELESSKSQLENQSTDQIRILSSTVKELKDLVNHKSKTIKDLLSEIETKDHINRTNKIQIAKLKETVEKWEKIQSNNKCYILIESKDYIKSLRKQGWIEKGRTRAGFILIPPWTMKNPSRAGFKPCDCTENYINLSSYIHDIDLKDIRTPHRTLLKDSDLEKSNGTRYFYIPDPNRFWSTSRWLIIRNG